MGDVITVFRETFIGSLNGGKAGKVEPGPPPGIRRVDGAMFRSSGRVPLSFAPNGRYVQRGDAAVVGGRRSRLACCRIPTSGPLPTLPYMPGGVGRGPSSRQFP